MAKLYGAQRMVLQALLDSQGQTPGFIEDNTIAQVTTIALGDVRNWLETLEGDEYINLARTESGLSASITAKGRLVLGPVLPPASKPPVTPPPTKSPTTPVSAAPAVRTILILAANPTSTERLRLDEEVKKIEQGLERAKGRDQFKLVVKWAVTDDDLRRALLDNDPAIVHFSGHGSGSSQGGQGRELVPALGEDSGGLAFEDDRGHVQLIPGDALARLFELCADSVKCVVLNACYSEAQANAISQHIDYVVGMKKSVGDEAAIKFAVGFYDALGAGRDFEKAFKFGCIAIDLKGIPEYLTPVLKKKRTD